MPGFIERHGHFMNLGQSKMNLDLMDVTSWEQIVSMVAQIAIENGVQLNVHAIGDRANREVLNVFEAAFKRHPGSKDLRWRIEHAQHLNPSDIPRLGQLGVIASMQGIHATSDAPYVLQRLGAARAEGGAYVWQRLMKSGAVISNGTDTHSNRSFKSADCVMNFPNECGRAVC